MPRWNIKQDLDPNDPKREWALFDGKQFYMSGLSLPQAEALQDQLNRYDQQIATLKAAVNTLQHQAQQIVGGE